VNARQAVGAVVLGGTLALTGCGAPDGDSGETSGPTPKPTRSATATPTPSATPTSGPVEPVGTPLAGQDAYVRCVALVSQSLYADRPVTPAPYGSADVITRTDGLIYVYTEVTVEDAPDAAQRDVAFECVHGGTLEEPVDYLYGAVVRSPLAERDPNMSLSFED
jgi:hypothetical protein